ncbi:ankyrin repeat domain-containing protein [bacterium]|nr:ankyrin repeat domain-containing protein [bacterium]
MKHLLLTTIAAVVLVGCGNSKDIWKAARKGNIDAVQEHLASGEDVNGKDKNGLTPLHIAQSKEMVELLISNGADINAKNIFGGSPLDSAARGSKKEIVELLISKGADVNAKDDGGQTPLHTAAIGDKKEIAEILIAHGANVNQIDDERTLAYTPLHFAVIGESSEVIKLLISKNVDINANSYNGTAFDVAVELKHEGIIDLLRKHGGKSGAKESLFIAAYLGKI